MRSSGRSRLRAGGCRARKSSLSPQQFCGSGYVAPGSAAVVKHAEPGSYPDFFQDVHAGREEVPYFECESHEFEMKSWLWFIHDITRLILAERGN